MTNRRGMLLAILTGLFAPFAKPQDQYIASIEELTGYYLTLDQVGPIKPSEITMMHVKDTIKDNHWLLQIEADGRKVRFSAKEVMDILEGKSQ